MHCYGNGCPTFAGFESWAFEPTVGRGFFPGKLCDRKPEKPSTQGSWCPAFQPKESWGSLFRGGADEEQSWASRSRSGAEKNQRRASPRFKGRATRPSYTRMMHGEKAPTSPPVGRIVLHLGLLAGSGTARFRFHLTVPKPLHTVISNLELHRLVMCRDTSPIGCRNISGRYKSSVLHVVGDMVCR